MAGGVDEGSRRGGPSASGMDAPRRCVRCIVVALFQVFRANIRGLWYPAVLSEEGAAFVQGNGVAADFDARIVGGVRQLQRVGNPADRIHGVPNTHEVNRAGPARERLLETLRQIE